MLKQHRLEQDVRLERVVSVMVISLLISIICFTSAYLTQNALFAILYGILGTLNAVNLIVGILFYRKIKTLHNVPRKFKSN